MRGKKWCPSVSRHIHTVAHSVSYGQTLKKYMEELATSSSPYDSCQHFYCLRHLSEVLGLTFGIFLLLFNHKTYTYIFMHTQTYIYICVLLCLPLKFFLPLLPFNFFLLEECLPNTKWSEGREAHNMFQLGSVEPNLQ